MSASESLPVSMTIGLLKPVLRSSLQASRPSMSGRPTSSSNEVEVLGLDGIDALRGRAGRHDLEFVVQRQLVLQRLTKVLVVVDDENLSCGAHAALAPVTGLLPERGSLASDMEWKQSVTPAEAALEASRKVDA